MQDVNSQVKYTIQSYEKSPFKLRLRYMLPFGLGLNKLHNPQVIEILSLLDALGMRNLTRPSNDSGEGSSNDDQPLDVIAELKAALEDAKYNQQAAKIFLDKVYEIFEILNNSHIEDRQPGLLAVLKKSIHKFVEANKVDKDTGGNFVRKGFFGKLAAGFKYYVLRHPSDAQEIAYDKRIINLKKLAIQQEEKQKTAGFFARVWHGVKRLNSDEKVFRTKQIQYGLSTQGKLNPYLAYKLQEIERGKVGPYILADDNLQQDIAQVLQKLRTDNSPLVAGMSDEAITADAKRLFQDAYLELQPTNAKKKRLRRIKNISDLFANTCTVFIGIGEGMVAGILSGFITPIAISIMVMGGTTNYFLFKPSSKSVFRTLTLGRLYKDADGREVSNVKKILITLTVVCSAAGAAAQGVLSFASAVAAVAKIFAMVGGILGIGALIAFPPLGLAILGGLVGVVTAVSLGCAFYISCADLIKNNRLGKIKAFFIENYGLPGYSNATVTDWIKHFLKCGFLSVGVLLAFSITTFATFGTGGRFHLSMVNFLSGSAHLSAKLSVLLSNAIVYILFTPLNFLFLAEGNAKVFVGLSQAAYKALINITYPIVHPIKTAKAIGSAIKSFYESPFTAVTKVRNFLARNTLLGFAVGNGAGQGIGAAVSGSLVHSVFPFISTSLGGLFSMFAEGISSFALNGKEIIKATSNVESVSYAKVTQDIRAKTDKLFKEGRVHLSNDNNSLEKVSKKNNAPKIKLGANPYATWVNDHSSTAPNRVAAKSPATVKVVNQALAKRRAHKFATKMQGVFNGNAARVGLRS